LEDKLIDDQLNKNIFELDTKGIISKEKVSWKNTVK